jgi:hypothetical protein
MADGSSEYQIRIDTVADSSGANQAVSDLQRVNAAVADGAQSTQAAAQADGQLSSSQSRAREVAQQYGTTIFVAAQALQLLGEESKSAAVGSAELDAAVESANRAAIEAGPRRAAYLKTLRESTQAMLDEMAAIDKSATADQKKAVMTDAVVAALKRMGITEEEVSLQSQRLNASYEGTARAMIAIKNAELASEVKAIREEMEGTTSATTDEASALEQLGSQLSQRGEQRHILTSIREIARGGAYEIRGEAEATFLLGQALDTLLPGLGIVVGITSGMALVTQVLEEHAQKVQEQADKAKAKTDEADASGKTYAENLKSTYAELEKSAETSFGSIGEMYQDLISQTRAATQATKDLQRAQDELKSAKLAAQIAELDSKEEEEEAGQTPDQQAATRRKYTGLRLNVRQRFDEDQAQSQVASLKSDLSQARLAVLQKQSELTAQQNKYADMLKDADNAALGLIANKVQSDAEFAESQVGALREKRNLGAASQADINSLGLYEDIAPLLREKENVSGKSFDTLQRPRLEAALAANLQTAREHPDEEVGVKAASDAQDIKDQLQAIAYYQSAIGTLADGTKANAKEQTEGRAALTQLQGTVDALTVRVQAAELKASTLSVVEVTDQEKLKVSDANAEAKHAFDIRQAARDAEIKRLEAQEGDPQSTDDQRAATKAKIDQITAQGDQDKLANANALGLSDADRIRLGGVASADQKKASNVIEKQSQEDSYESQLLKDQEELNNARSALASQEAIARTTKETHDTNVKHADLTATLARTMADNLQAYKDRVEKAEQAIRTLQLQQKQNRNNAQN